MAITKYKLYQFGYPTFIMFGLTFLFNNLTLYGQDTLVNKSLKELDKLSVNAFENDNIELSRIYSRYQIEKAKSLKDSFQVAYAYYSYLMDDNLELALKYCDSVIIYSKNSTHKSYPTYGYLTKGTRLLKAGRFDKAMENLVKAYEYAKKKDNKVHIYLSHQAMGAIKSYIGEFEEALKLHEENYRFIINNPNIRNWESKNLTNIYNLAIVNIKLRKLDSARHYTKLGLKLAEKDTYRYYKLVGAHAEIDYMNGLYSKALDSMLKYLKHYDGNALANKYYYLGKIYGEQGIKETSKSYFQKVDSIVTRDNDPFPEVKDVYQSLAKLAYQNGNDSLQIIYINKYIWADSILSNNREIINPLMEIKFDTPRMLAERNRLMKKASTSNIWIYAVSTTCLFLMLFGCYQILMRRKLKKKLSILMDEGIKTVPYKESSSQNYEEKIPREIAEDIKLKLVVFESSKLLYDSKLTLSLLAKKLNTNSTYLSSYINHYKGKNFPSYLKELRIKLAVERLKKEPQFLKYSLQGIASEFGFNTPGAFSKAFLENAGVRPSKFLKELTKEG